MKSVTSFPSSSASIVEARRRADGWTAAACKRRSTRSWIWVSILAGLAAAGCCSERAQAASGLKVLAAFKSFRGVAPAAGLIADQAGNLYGTTENGGANNYGVVFELTPPTARKRTWTETVLFSFNGANGKNPTARLAMDSAGNIYGTTATGGDEDEGVAFELTPPPSGKKKWKETVIQSFNGANGTYPEAGMILDEKGNLYGTTSDNGAGFGGILFELTPPENGSTTWNETIIVDFRDEPALGYYPKAELLFDLSGNLYGTTSQGGEDASYGVAFELSPPGVGQTSWTVSGLFDFSPNYHPSLGVNPVGGLAIGGGGKLYGMTMSTIFRLSAIPEQIYWKGKVLGEFSHFGGEIGAGNLIRDESGNLYGVSYSYTPEFRSIIFKLSPPRGRLTKWTASILRSFSGKDGAHVNGTLIADKKGNLFGTTSDGGSKGEGTAFELSPQDTGP